MLKRRRAARRTSLILTRGSCKLVLFLLLRRVEGVREAQRPDASDVFNDDFHDARP